MIKKMTVFSPVICGILLLTGCGGGSSGDAPAAKKAEAPSTASTETLEPLNTETVETIEAPAYETATVNVTETTVTNTATVNPFDIHQAESDNSKSGDNDADALPDLGLDKVFINYFDIAIGASAGEQVTGTIQLADNRKATFGKADFSDYRFAIVGSKDNGKFELQNVYQKGRVHGLLKVAQGQSIDADSGTTLRVELKQNDTAVSRFNVPIHAAAETQWQTYYRRLIGFAESESRMWGRRDTLYGNVRPKLNEPSVEEVLTEIESNDGQFSDLHIYQMEKNRDLLKYSGTKNIKAYEEAARRLGGLGYALSQLDPKDVNYKAKHDRLIAGIVSGFNAYAKRVPVKKFDDFSCTTDNGLNFNDRTHQWRWLDPVSLPIILAFDDTWKAAQAGDLNAKAFLDHIYYLYQIAFALPYSDRFDRTFYANAPLRTRYFLEKDVSRSPGAWNDANRHHRIRSWATMAGVWKDYNRPLTDKPWWYSDYTPFAKTFTTASGLTYSAPGVTIFKQWQPQGAFQDLKVWVDTNTQTGFTLNNSGLLPDGTISHHTGARQDLALFAYGYSWMASTPMTVAELLKGSVWQASNKTIDNSSAFILKTMAPIIYKDGHDYQSAGRSFLSEQLNHFGRDYIARDIPNILSGKDENADLVFETDLLDLKADLENGTHEVSGSFPYWNSEFLVHRRGNDGERPWYASWRSQSIRVRGAESFSSQPGSHNGSGILQVKVDGDEYNDARLDWDWHLQPGLTEEWRTDNIPMQSQDHANGLSIEVLAGVLSDRRNSVASFKYSTKATYASAKADKSAFFSDEGVFAIGDNIRRDIKKGGFASDHSQPIVTTVDQAKWSTALSYDLGEGQQSVAAGTRLDLSFTINAPVWLHQGKKGYIIWPDSSGSSELKLVAGDAVSDTYQLKNPDVDIYSIVINHGINPDNSSDDYQYLILPNVTADQMPELFASYNKATKLQQINGDEIYGVRWRSDNRQLIQLAFHQSGSLILDDGKKISVDKPALVMLTEQAGSWKVAVSDPTHHSQATDPDTRSEFRVYLKPEENIINVDLNWRLTPGVYQYNTQGYEEKYFARQDITVTANGGGSRLSVNLPDDTDDKIYGLREELFSGMSAVAEVPTY